MESRKTRSQGHRSWADSARYDIDAKVAGPDVPELQKIKNEDRGVLLQPLLSERFKLAIHAKPRYFRFMSWSLRRMVPNLRRQHLGTQVANGLKGAYGVRRAGMMTMRPGQLTAQAVPMTVLANQLSRQLHRTVIDKTGLTGKYDFSCSGQTTTQIRCSRGQTAAPKERIPHLMPPGHRSLLHFRSSLG